ncbi:MAG TPA: PAS domain-containing protein [Candidatus Sulfotelmatobacter sp.]|nr:PAS domain-containing protein [Candidatus Sulfotelmatobacter sp.]
MALVREAVVRIMANPALLRAMVVLFCSVFAFLSGLIAIRFLRNQIAEESEIKEEAPHSMDALPMHLYNTVIQQLKQQKHEILAQLQADQQRAKTSEALSHAVLSNLPCGVLVLGANGLVKTFNPAAKVILGFASMVGMSAQDIFRGAVARKERPDGNPAAQDPVAVADEIHAVLHEGSQRRELESEYQAPGGEKRFLAMTISPLPGADGALLGVACLINDLSQLEAMRKQQELRDEMSAEMALKLRSSLRTITGYAQQMLASGDSEGAAQLADDIGHEAAQIDQSVGGFLSSGSSDTRAAMGAAAGS